jgi:hypothetical protein
MLIAWSQLLIGGRDAFSTSENFNAMRVLLKISTAIFREQLRLMNALNLPEKVIKRSRLYTYHVRQLIGWHQ